MNVVLPKFLLPIALRPFGVHGVKLPKEFFKVLVKFPSKFQ